MFHVKFAHHTQGMGSSINPYGQPLPTTWMMITHEEGGEARGRANPTTKPPNVIWIKFAIRYLNTVGNRIFSL